MPDPIEAAGEKVKVAGQKAETAGEKIEDAGTKVKLAVISALGILLANLGVTAINAWQNDRNLNRTRVAVVKTGTDTQEQLGEIHKIVNSSYTAAVKRELVLLEQVAEEKADLSRAYPKDLVAKQAAIRWQTRAEETRRHLRELEAVPPARPGLFPPPATAPSAAPSAEPGAPR